MITDIVLISIIALSIIIGFYKGFASSSLEFLSSIISLIASYFIAGVIATFVFDTFLRADFIDSIFATMQSTAISSVDPSTIVNGFLSEIDADFLKGIANSFVADLGIGVVNPTVEGATIIVDSVVRPVVEILIGFVAFIILFIILKLVVRSFAKSLELVNKIPLIGIGNRLMGIVSGGIIGVIYATLITFIFILVGLVSDSQAITQNLIYDSRIVSTVLNTIIDVVN